MKPLSIKISDLKTSHRKQTPDYNINKEIQKVVFDLILYVQLKKKKWPKVKSTFKRVALRTMVSCINLTI